MINICRPHNFRRHNSRVSNTLRLLNLSNTIKMFSESCQIYAKHMGLYIQYVAFLVKLLLLILTPSLNIWRTQICVVMTIADLSGSRIFFITCFPSLLQWPFSGRGIGKKGPAVYYGALHIS